MDKQALIDALRDVRFLHDIDNEHLRQIADVTRLRDVEPGQILFREGEVPQDVFLVVSGSVALDINTSGGGSKRVGTVGPGEILGWSALLEQTQMTATATTLCPTKRRPDQHRPTAHDLQAQSAVRLRTAAADVAGAGVAAQRNAAAAP